MTQDRKRYSRKSPNPWSADEDCDRWTGPVRTMVLVASGIGGWVVYLLFVHLVWGIVL